MSDAPALAHPAPVHPVSAPTAMPTDIAPADTHAVFAELVCADRGLLQAEFDALIAANFPPGDGRRSRYPPRRPGPTGRRRCHRRSPRRGPGPIRDPVAGPAPTLRLGNASRLDSIDDPNSQEETSDRADQVTKEVIGIDPTGSPRATARRSSPR